MIDRNMLTSCCVMAVTILPLSMNVHAVYLEPSALPAQSMKTLDEVEPRIPIPGSDTAVGTYVINSSRSYYLSGDRMCSGVGLQQH